MAQRASLRGTVSDSTGGVLPGVSIIALNVDQGLKREASTDSSGSFSIPLLQPGNYVVSAEKQGFAILEVTELLLHVGDARTLQLVLPIAKVRIQIRVNDRTGGVETVNPTLGQVVTGNVIRDAPLDGRNVMELAVLQPGVLPVNADALGVTGFSVTGNREDSVAALLDGAHNNNLLTNTITYAPNPDAISEFRVLTSNYTADYGRNGGGIIAFATKSGTNVFHGTAFDFLRNEALNANSFFNKNHNQPRSVLKRNQFGGTLGGPLGLPFQPGQDRRAFFFASYQGTRQIQDVSSGGQTFTPEELQGDFSKAAASPEVQSFLEANPFFVPSGKTPADAIIDPLKFNTVAKNYLQAGLIPSAPFPGLVVAPGREQTNSDELTTRFDFELSPKDKVSLTLGGSRSRFVEPFSFAVVPGFPTESQITRGFASGSYVRMFSPTVLNELRLGVQRSLSNNENPLAHLPTPQDLGTAITPDRPTGPPGLQFFDSGLTVGFSQQGPSMLANNTFSVGDSLTWVRSRHTWKFGGGISSYQNNTAFAFLVDGLYSFSSIGTGTFTTGSDLANFLVGLPTFYQQGPNAHSNIRSKMTNFFVSDEWHVRSNLVLTLGLRYEYSTPKSDTDSRTFSLIPGRQSQVFSNAPVSLLFPGDAGAPRGVNFPDKNDFAPRFGFAWDISGKGKTSLRGGAGVFYNIVKADDNLQFNGQPPFYSAAGILFPDPPPGPITSDVPYLAQPFTATGATNPFPSKPPSSNIDFNAAGFLPFGAFGGVYVVDPHLRTPYIAQFNLSLQHDLGSNAILELSYAGSSSRKLISLVDANPFQLGTFSRVLNTLPGNNDGSFAQILEFANVSSAQFNSLEASLRKEVSHNRWFGDSYFTLAYTYSHNIDNASGSGLVDNRNTIVPAYDHDRFRASSDFDLRHRIVFSGGWKLPFGEVWPAAPKRLAQGWRVFPLVRWRTGFPIDVFANLPNSSDFTSPGPSAAGDGFLARTNLVGPLQLFDPHQVQTLHGIVGHYLFDPYNFSDAALPSDTDAVNNPGLRTYGNLPRNFFRGASSVRADLAIAKETALWGERLNGEFRADFFNLFNHTTFGDPYTNINNPSLFGQILSAGDPRIIQLSLRLTF
jgi:Carboxypeptidase regulatory-like domain/TonB-dependent Receptor Plug Domain